MKFLSVFMVGLLLFLSFNGTAKPDMAPIERPVCCHDMQAKTNKQACNDKKTQSRTDNCNKQGCPMMLSCSVCGFLAAGRLQIRPSIPNHIPKPVSLYKMGNITAYHTSDWKPPKAC